MVAQEANDRKVAHGAMIAASNYDQSTRDQKLGVLRGIIWVVLGSWISDMS